MKKTVARLLTAGLLACSAGIALADGIPTAANVAEAPYAGNNDWRGFYVSAAIGYSFGDADLRVGPDSTSIDPDGVTGTVGLGYDIMLRDNILIGVLADYTFGELDDDFTLAGVGGKWKLDDTWAVGGRVGTFIHKDLLLYGTVGYTRTEFTLSNAAGSASEDLDGFFVGAGLERMLCNNLYLKGEYRYSDFEDLKGVTDPVGCGGGGCRFKEENDTHSIRLGVAYKFGGRREEAAPLK